MTSLAESGTGGDPWVARARAGDPVVEAALAIYEDDRLRAVVEGYLLAGVGPEGICERFSVSPSVVDAYVHLYLDVRDMLPGDRALLALDEDAPPLVRRLRAIGLREGAPGLDHALGMRDLDAEQRRVLERRLLDRLVARAAHCQDLHELDRMSAIVARLTPTHEPEGASDARSELETLLQELRARVAAPTIPMGLPRELFERDVAVPRKARPF